VALLQEAMAAAGFFRDEIDGVFGERTAAAVVAVHKALDAERTVSWAEADWEALAGWAGPNLPERPEEPDRIEIDLTRQLLYRIEDEGIVDVIPISSGNGEPYQNARGEMVRARTPRGDFALYKHYDGWRISYLGGLYRPWYFRGGYAIHGSASVPPVPASHGCIRVPNWEADHLADVLVLGLPVHVWD
jgi:peptidoglycan hydrolase-like protein with peptidoglycan-binding domain